MNLFGANTHPISTSVFLYTMHKDQQLLGTAVNKLVSSLVQSMNQ